MPLNITTLSMTTLNIITLCHYTECHCAECRDLFIVIMNVIMLGVVAPFKSA
jgi:hypothetical protein